MLDGGDNLWEQSKKPEAPSDGGLQQALLGRVAQGGAMSGGAATDLNAPPPDSWWDQFGGKDKVDADRANSNIGVIFDGGPFGHGIPSGREWLDNLGVTGGGITGGALGGLFGPKPSMPQLELHNLPMNGGFAGGTFNKMPIGSGGSGMSPLMAELFKRDKSIA